MGLVLTVLHTFVLSDGGKVMGDALPMQIVVWAGALFFLWYAWTMTKRGVLR